MTFYHKRKNSVDLEQENKKKPFVYTHENDQVEDVDNIKQFSSDQRLALPDEPNCIVCGKYGEYISNETDHDVCSLQCKAMDVELNSSRVKKKAPPVKIVDHVHDYVATNIHAKLTNYQEPKSIATQSTEQVNQMLKAHDIQVKGAHIPKPFSTFDQLRDILGDTLLANIESLGWSMATGIQRQAVTIGLAGRDVMAIAPTHSGKTGAFLIPMLVHCVSLSIRDNYKRRAGPYAMIMASTREICSQIQDICQKLAQGLRNMRTGLFIGGEPLPPQIHRLKKGVQIIIGTPGRLLDLAQHHASLLRVWNIQMLILDEADTMFSLGFGVQVKQLLGKLPTTTLRQTSYFSATMDDAMISTLYKKLISPVEIRLKQEQVTTTTTTTTKKLPTPSDKVRQTLLWVENKSKSKRLFSILRDPKYFVVPILIFVASRLGSEFLSRAIKKKCPHFRIMTMHGDKTQEERALIIKGINQAEPLWDIIVSTDILSRGIDLPFVRLVINYDMSTTLEDYVHRIGRAILQVQQLKQEKGWSITFINEENESLFEPLTHMLASLPSSQVTPLPSQLKRYLPLS